MFKKKSECNRIIQLIREYGEQYEVEQPGRVNTIKQDTVLHLLECRSLRLRKHNNITTNESHNWYVVKLAQSISMLIN